MEEILLKSIILQILFIFLLLLNELGVLRRIYEELYTNPKTKVLIYVFGDVLYMVGGSILASATYAFLTKEAVDFTMTSVVGIIFVFVGAYLKGKD